jgi:hypothetical protein
LMKPLRNLQRGFGRSHLLNVAPTTTPSVIEKTKEVVIPYPEDIELGIFAVEQFHKMASDLVRLYYEKDGD